MMKKIIFLVLVLILIVAGCAKEDDQMVTKITTNYDTYVYSYEPDTNYNSSSGLFLGYDPGWPTKTRMFLGFDLSTIPKNAEITSAKLYMRQWAGVGSDATITFNIYRVTGSWTASGITWNNQPSVESSPTITGLTCAKATSNTWRSWTVTDLVKEMITESDNLMMLKLQSESGTVYNEQSFYYNVSYLEVTYKLPLSIADAQGAIDRRVLDIEVAASQGAINKTVIGMKIASSQGAINKTIF